MQTPSKYADLYNEAHQVSTIIPQNVGVEIGISLYQDVIGWKRSKTTRESLCEDVIVRQFAQANNGILAGAYSELDTTNTEHDSERKKEAEDPNLHRMAKVHEFVEMWQGSQNLHATQKESWTQNKQMTAMGYISDTEEIVKTSSSVFQHDGAAAFKLSDRSPSPPPLSAKDFPGGGSQIFNVRRIRRIHPYPVESDVDSAPECISDSEDWLNWTGDFDIPNDREDDYAPDVQSDTEPDNGIEFRECPELRDVIATPNVSGLKRPTRNSQRQAERMLLTVNAIETRRNKGVKNK